MNWWTAFVLFEGLWVAICALWIVFERRSPTATLAWIFGLALLPGLGLPFYFFFGPRRLERKKSRYRGLRRRLERSMAAIEREGAIPPDVERLVELGARLGEAPLTTVTELELYRGGASLFAALEAAIAGATHHVHLESYIWEPDGTGTRLRDLLIDRARAGVVVRVLVDDVGANANQAFFAPLVAAGGAAARFNPLRFGSPRFRFFNFRSHRKIAVVDGAVGFTGGMNVADCQTVGIDGKPPWRDTHLRLAGRVVRSLQRVFLENWQYATGDAPFERAYFPHLGVGPHRAQIVSSGPDRLVYPIHEFTFAAIAAADERVWVASPYVVPDDAMLTALRSAAHRGVDVRVLVPVEGDSRLVAAAVRSYYADLLEAGIRVFEYLPAMMHAKTLVVDRELAMVGTANLDNRSFRLNFEVVAAIYDEAFVDRLAGQFVEDLADARAVDGDTLAARPWRPRLAEAGARLFATML